MTAKTQTNPGRRKKWANKLHSGEGWFARLQTMLLQKTRFYTFLIVCLAITTCSEIEPPQVSGEGEADEPTLQQMQRQIRPPFLDPLGPGDLFYNLDSFPPPTEEGNKPYPVKTILITARTDSSISLRWHDRSSVEVSTLLRRRKDGGPGWEEAFTYGPVSGFNDVTDEGLEPDQRYCYQFVASNEHGSSYSPQRCAYTEGNTGQQIYRAQLRVKTANISDAGTDDKIRVRLNAAPGGLTVPFGNVTVMDYGQDDFERQDDFLYDLELTGIVNSSDITLLSISKNGSDGLCIESIELLLNNVSVFDQDFSNTGDKCHWIDNEGGHSNIYSVSHESLRAHPGWQGLGPTIQLSIDRDEIESRIEGLIGHLFSSIDDAKWGDRHGRAWVEASYRNDKRVSVDLDMEGEVPYWFNADVDIDFDATVGFKEEDGEWKFELTVSNLEATTDFDWFTEALSFILPCGPVVSVVLNEGIPDCTTYLERYIDDRIEGAFQPIARSFALDNPCPAGTRPDAFVSEIPNIIFRCVEEGVDDEPNSIRIRGNAVVFEAIDSR